MMEAFMAKIGVHPMRMMTDENGKQFMYDPHRQTYYPIVKRFLRYLKVIM